MSPPFLPLSLLVTSPISFRNRQGVDAFGKRRIHFNRKETASGWVSWKIMPGSCVAVGMGFGSVDIARTLHDPGHVPGLPPAHLLGAETCGVPATSFRPLYSLADAGLLWN